MTQTQGISRGFQGPSPPFPPPEIPHILVFPDCDPVPVAHREAHSSAGIKRKYFSRGVEIGVGGQGLESPSTGWWRGLLFPQGISDRPFLGFFLETWCLTQCVPSPQASCFLPYPLCPKRCNQRAHSNLSSCPKAGSRHFNPGEIIAGKEARSSGASSLSAVPYHAPQRPSGCGDP